MIPCIPGKTESAQSDPTNLTRVLETELIEKRAAWQRANTRYRAARILSFFFLFIVILAAGGAFLFLFSRAKDAAASRPSSSVTSEQRH